MTAAGGGLEPALPGVRPSGMHGTLKPTTLTAARRSTRRRTLAIVAVVILAGIVTGAALLHTLEDDDLMIWLGVTYPKDCG